VDNNFLQDTTSQPLEEDGSGQRLVWLLLGIAALGCGLLFALAFLFFRPDAQTLVDQYFPSPTSTATRTPIPTATPTKTPTNTPTATPNMTARAFETTAASAADEWNEFVSETFDTNKSDWYVGTDDDQYAKVTYDVKNGKYIWDATAHQGFVQRVWVSPIAVKNFYFSVEVNRPGSTTLASQGFSFREDGTGNYYFFSIRSGAYFNFWLQNAGEWIELIKPTKSSALRPDGANKISILAEADHFIFFINDQYVADIHDDTLDRGKVGLVIEISDADINAVFEFDNILLKLPK